MAGAKLTGGRSRASRSAPSGITWGALRRDDQTIAALAKPGHALLLECASLEAQQIPLPKACRLLVVDTGVRHDLLASAFNTRRAECDAAVKRSKSSSLSCYGSRAGPRSGWRVSKRH